MTSSLAVALAARLGGGDRRSIGAADLVASEAMLDAAVFAALIDLLDHADPLVRMRAADAAEKASRNDHALLGPHRARLLSLLGSATQQEVRWHLAQMSPRAGFDTSDRRRAFDLLVAHLDDPSQIVRVAALQALTELAQLDPARRDDTRRLLRHHARRGGPAVRARCRKLAALLD